MSNSDYVKQEYWDERKKRLDIVDGKKRAILQAVDLLSKIRNNQNLSLLELGCGAGDIIFQIQAHCISQDLWIERYIGVDKDDYALYLATTHNGANIKIVDMDYTNEELHSLGQFDVVILVNSLHEVFSSCRQDDYIDVVQGKKYVQQTLKNIANSIKSGGYLLIFDGVEDALADVEIDFTLRSHSACLNFERFVEEYRGLKIDFKLSSEKVTMPIRDFTRYVTKSIFLDSETWEIEKFESYQYYKYEEFHTILQDIGFKNFQGNYYSPSREKWSEDVTLLTEGIDFPNQHLLLVSQRL